MAKHLEIGDPIPAEEILNRGDKRAEFRRAIKQHTDVFADFLGMEKQGATPNDVAATAKGPAGDAYDLRVLFAQRVRATSHQ